MAYSDYGAFVYLNGERREDKEDTSTYDVCDDLYHGVMGDGSVRVCCYKQGWPVIYYWEDGYDDPVFYSYDCLSRKFGWEDFDEYEGIRYAPYTYHKEFDFLGWHFSFDGDECGATPKYSAKMERDGEYWVCDYDYMFGAGISDQLH